MIQFVRICGSHGCRVINLHYTSKLCVLLTYLTYTSIKSPLEIVRLAKNKWLELAIRMKNWLAFQSCFTHLLTKKSLYLQFWTVIESVFLPEIKKKKRIRYTYSVRTDHFRNQEIAISNQTWFCQISETTFLLVTLAAVSLAKVQNRVWLETHINCNLVTKDLLLHLASWDRGQKGGCWASRGLGWAEAVSPTSAVQPSIEENAASPMGKKLISWY